MLTAEQFGSKFSAVTKGQLPDILEHWPNQRRFTNSYVNPMLLPALADALDCNLSIEHLFGIKRMDAVFHGGLDPHDKQVVAALEHENNLSYSGEEIAKLRDFAAPLGILITYASARRRASLLAEYEAIIAAKDRTFASSEGREILVILGPYGFNRPQNLAWDFFVHKGDEFRRM